MPDVSFPALVIAVDRQEADDAGDDAAGAFTRETGIPVHAAVTMTDVLTHLDATGRLTGERPGRLRRLPRPLRDRTRPGVGQSGGHGGRATAAAPA